MKDIKLFWRVMGKNRFTYFISMLSTIFIQIFSGITPVIIMVSVDSIIGNKPLKYSALGDVVSLMGGREFLRDNIYLLGLLIILFNAVSCIFIFFRNFYSNYATENIIFDLRNKIYNKFLRMDISCFSEYNAGDLIQRSTSDIETLRKLFAIQLVNVFGSVATIVLVVIIMSLINIKFALVCLSICLLIGILSYVFYGKISRLFAKTDEAESDLVVIIKEILFNFRVIKAFNIEKFIFDKFEEKNSKFNSMQNIFMKTFANFRAINDFLTFLQVAIVLVFGGYETIVGRMNFGDLIAFVIYLNMIIWPIRQLGQLLSDMAKAKVSISRIYEILDLKEEDYEKGRTDINFNGEIEFKNVSFKIDDNLILDDINFKLEGGKSLGIIGSTGSGKSSIVNLLIGLFSPTNGDIYIDNVNVNELNKKKIREKIASVLQDSELFNLSIIDNINITNNILNKELVYNCARISSIHDEILSFTSGYETVIVDNGNNLSGGQKQRISIARSLMKDFDILVLDDTLSAVDMDTDAKIKASLNSIEKKPTSIIIAHRISTISSCDEIIVMDKGRIVERGTHDELLKLNGVYNKIHELQSKE